MINSHNKDDINYPLCLLVRPEEDEQPTPRQLEMLLEESGASSPDSGTLHPVPSGDEELEQLEKQTIPTNPNIQEKGDQTTEHEEARIEAVDERMEEVIRTEEPQVRDPLRSLRCLQYCKDNFCSVPDLSARI